MNAKFYVELAALLEKYDARLAAETNFDDWDRPTLAVVFPDIVEDIGSWVSADYLRKYFPNYFGECKL